LFDTYVIGPFKIQILLSKSMLTAEKGSFIHERVCCGFFMCNENAKLTTDYLQNL